MWNASREEFYHGAKLKPEKTNTEFNRRQALFVFGSSTRIFA